MTLYRLPVDEVDSPRLKGCLSLFVVVIIICLLLLLLLLVCIIVIVVVAVVVGYCCGIGDSIDTTGYRFCVVFIIFILIYYSPSTKINRWTGRIGDSIHIHMIIIVLWYRTGLRSGSVICIHRIGDSIDTGLRAWHQC